YRHGLDVSRMWKHIHHPCAGKLESLAVYQNFSIPRQTARMAGNIHDSARLPMRHAPEQCSRAGPRRVEQDQVVALPVPGSELRRFEEIFHEEGRIANAVSSAVGGCLGN